MHDFAVYADPVYRMQPCSMFRVHPVLSVQTVRAVQCMYRVLGMQLMS